MVPAFRDHHANTALGAFSTHSFVTSSPPMGSLFTRLSDWFAGPKKLEAVLVGLENSGKSTFCNYIQMGKNDLVEPPTVGLNVKILKKGSVSLKVWDIGGQASFRDEWPRYCKGVDCIVFVVDTSDVDRIPAAKHELHRLLENQDLHNMPILVRIPIAHSRLSVCSSFPAACRGVFILASPTP